jgi:hypothetical protein
LANTLVLKQHVIQSCRFLLLPVIRFLLKHGVTWDEFGELSKDAYVAVAREDYGIQGRPTNNSRVAMLTGLSRREVAEVRDRLLDGEQGASSLQGNRLSRILSGWHTDSEFTDEHDQPKDLPATGSAGSLSSLLKRYAGDLPHGAIRKEMRQRGLIEDLKDGQVRVLKRDYVFSSLDPEIVRQMSLALHDHATTLEHNLDENRTSERRFEGMADNVKMSPKAFKEFQNLVATRGFSFLEEVDAWLSRNEIDETKDADARTVRLGVGVYLIHDESEQGLVK